MEYKTSWAWVWKNGIWENEQTEPPLWKVYQQDDYTRVFTYDSTYYNGYYHETVSWDENASYRDTDYPDGSRDYDVKTGGTVSGTLLRWTDDSSLNEQKALNLDDQTAWPWARASQYYNYDYGYWWGFFLAPPDFTPGHSSSSGTATTWHHEQTGGFSTNGFSVTWDYTRDDTYSDLYTTPELLEYARTVLASEPYYPGGDDEWETSQPWEAWIAYRDLDSDETFLDWGAGLYRMGFTGTAGVAYELKWIERFIPDDDGPAVDSVITEWVLATGRPQHTSVHYVDPPSTNGYVVIVLPKVVCSECAAGTETIRNGSVDFSISLGKSKSGDSAGRLYLYGTTPTNTLAAPEGLRQELLRDTSIFWGNSYLGKLIVAPEVVVATNVLGDQAYEIQLYHPVDFPGLSSAPTNAPFATWKIENPDTSGTNFNQLNIIKTADGTTITNQYVWSDEDQGWTLVTGGGLRQEAKVATTDGGTGDDIETTTIKNENGQTVYVERRRYHTLDAPFGRVLIERTADPDGVARTSSYEYFTNVVSDGVNYGKLKQIVSDDGSWTRSDYSTNGILMKEISGFGNAAPGAAENLCRVKEYDYTPVDAADDGSLDPTTPRTMIERLLGEEISRRYLIVLPGERREIQCVAPGAEPNDAGNLVTIIKSHTQGDERVLGKTKAVDFSNGTREVNSYDFYDPSPGQSFVTNTVLRGAPDSGNGTNVVSGTRTIIVTTGTGHSISTIAYDIESGIITASEVHSEFDSFGRPQRVTHLDGTHTDTLYGCCGVDSVTERDGSVVSYEYNALKQLVAGHRFVSATNAVTLLIERNPQGNALATSRVGTDTTRTELSASLFNLAGEIISLTNALGHPTTFTNYFDGNGHRVWQATYTDESTRVAVFYRDGQLQSRSGTTESKPVRYEYGVESEGGIQRRYTKEIKLDANGSDTGEWTKTYTDGASREYKATHSGGAVATRFYNSKGQLARLVDPDEVTALHQYNARGELEFTAIDMNANEEMDFAGTDRITQTLSDVVNDGSLGHIFRTRTYVWNTNDSAASNLLSTVAVSTDGLRQWNILWNDGVGVTNTRTIFYAGNGARHETNTAPDGSYTVSIFQNGMLQSFTRKDANGSQIGHLEYGYDAHNRPISVTDAATGTTSFTFNNADQIASATTPVSGTGQPAQTTTHDFDDMGRVWKTTLPDNTSVTNEFHLTGDLQRSYGSRTYPVGYGYDSQGRIKTMTNWSEFASSTGARVTTWNYHPTSGFLTNKVYDGNTAGPAYTWTAAGKLKTREWARGITTTNTYDGAGALKSVTYSDGTPALSFGYDRRGRQIAVTNGTTICAFAYSDAGELLCETYSGGPLAGLSVSNAYDSLLRRTAVGLSTQPTALNQFGYDAASRLKTVTNGSQTVSYDYQPNSFLVQALTFQQNGTTRLTTTRSYDNLNRLTAIVSAPSASSAISFRYAYNTANERTAVTNADNSRWLFGHDTLGQLTSGKKYWKDGTAVAGQQFEYEFDDIGNRTGTASGGHANSANLRSASYNANTLNQITNREVPGYLNLLSSAHSNATVTTWGASNLYSRATRKNSYFRSEIPLNNSNAPVWLTLTNLAVLNNGTNSDITATNIGDVFLARTPESFTFDADGNLTSDGRWTNMWSAENRLLSQTSLTGAPDGSKFKVAYTYDYAGRMVQRIVSTNDGTQYVASLTNRFIYDGNVQLAELDSTNGLVKFYVRGLDLSGAMQHAGGVGGLLAINAGANGTHFYAMDGSGNVAALVNANDGTTSAQYIYGPFGELLRASGPMASMNSIGFSSQYTDPTTRRVLYRFRSYDPLKGTWDSRDPLGEMAGAHLARFVHNSPVDLIDPLGLQGLPIRRGEVVPMDWNGGELIAPLTPGQFVASLPPPPEPFKEYTSLTYRLGALREKEEAYAVLWNLADPVNAMGLALDMGTAMALAPAYDLANVIVYGGESLTGCDCRTVSGGQATWSAVMLTTLIFPELRGGAALEKASCVGAKTAAADGAFYSVAFETKLSSTSYPGVTRYMHFKEANIALEAEMQVNPALAQLGISVPKSPTGSVLGKSPENWVWHHDAQPGVMQLVPKSQHPSIPGGIFWETMHPGGNGGFSIWGN